MISLLTFVSIQKSLYLSRISWSVLVEVSKIVWPHLVQIPHLHPRRVNTGAAPKVKSLCKKEIKPVLVRKKKGLLSEFNKKPFYFNAHI